MRNEAAVVLFSQAVNSLKHNDRKSQATTNTYLSSTVIDNTDRNPFIFDAIMQRKGFVK